jgi:hypothetical protein
MIIDIDTEPYVGLRPYGTNNANRFFGSSRESWELTSRRLVASRLLRGMTLPQMLRTRPLVRDGHDEITRP